MSVSVRTHAHRVPEGRPGPTLQHLPASEHGHGLIGAEARSTFRRAGEVVGWPPGPPWALWPGTASSLFCRAFPWAPQSHPSALGPERGSSNGFFAKYSYLCFQQSPSSVVMCMGWHGTNRRPTLLSEVPKAPESQERRNPPSLYRANGGQRGGGVESEQAPGLNFLPITLPPHLHALSLSLTHTHAHMP